MNRLAALAVLTLGIAFGAQAAAQPCPTAPLLVQPLNGAQIVWIEGKARLLIDAGPGAAARFREAGAAFADLEALLWTTLRVEDVNDFPVLVTGPGAAARTTPLPIYGPIGGKGAPDTVHFVRELFDPTGGLYRTWGELMNPMGKGAYKLKPLDIRERPAKLGRPRKPEDELLPVFGNAAVRVSAAYVGKEPVPTLAWRIAAANKVVVVSGAATRTANLALLAQGADLLVVPRPAAPAAPSAADLAELARAAGVKQLRVSGITAGDETLNALRKRFEGTLAPVTAMECVTP
jgi:ribonuclease BN (tRNA processing enzyme)